MGNHYRALDAKLIGFSDFTLADVLHLRCMQCVQFVFIRALLGLKATGTFKPES
jgi:hypothetical protein